jgi:hypothetical protein
MPSKGVCSVLRSRVGVVFPFLFVVAGCSRSSVPPVQPPPPPPIFPPQQVMESGNYAEFLAENERALTGCDGGTGCDVVLFNLGFTYAYFQSPYRDPAKALQYFSELSKTYPQSPWAFQGKAWTALLSENLVLEEKGRELQGNLRSREATIRGLREQLNRSRDIDVEMEKKERELLR